MFRGKSLQKGSGDDVGYQFILDRRDLVAETQLPALQPGKLHLIRLNALAKCLDRIVKVAVFEPKNLEPRTQFAVTAHVDRHPASEPLVVAIRPVIDCTESRWRQAG